MLKPEILDAFTTPEGHELRLVRRGRDLFIELDREELMSTRRTGSERALAELGCAHLQHAARSRVLIGGLGLSFTLRAALESLPAGGRVVVAELFERVVEWNRTHLAELQDGRLSDPRASIRVADVWDLVSEGPWDAILLDTDNGPDAWCLAGNDRLYGRSGLDRLRDALTPDGVLAVWSAGRDDAFLRRLRKAGFEAECRTARAHAGRGARYAVFLGRKRRPRGRPPVAQRRRRTSSKSRRARS